MHSSCWDCYPIWPMSEMSWTTLGHAQPNLCDHQQVGLTSTTTNPITGLLPELDKRSVVQPGKSDGASPVKGRWEFVSHECNFPLWLSIRKVIVSNYVEDRPRFTHYHVHDISCALWSAVDLCVHLNNLTRVKFLAWKLRLLPNKGRTKSLRGDQFARSQTWVHLASRV